MFLTHFLIIFLMIFLQENFLQIFSINWFCPNIALGYIFALIFFEKNKYSNNQKQEEIFLIFLTSALFIDFFSGAHFPFGFIYFLIAHEIITWIYSNFNKNINTYLISCSLAFLGYFVYNNLVISFFEKTGINFNLINAFYFVLSNLLFSIIFYFIFLNAKKNI